MSVGGMSETRSTHRLRVLSVHISQVENYFFPPFPSNCTCFASSTEKLSLVLIMWVWFHFLEFGGFFLHNKNKAFIIRIQVELKHLRMKLVKSFYRKTVCTFVLIRVMTFSLHGSFVLWNASYSEKAIDLDNESLLRWPPDETCPLFSLSFSLARFSLIATRFSPI